MLTFNEHLSCTGKVQTSLYSWCHIIFTEILWKYNVIPFREEVRPTPVKWPAFTIYILGKIWQTLDGSYSHALLIQAGNICLWCCRLLPIGVSDLLAQYSQKWAQNHSLNCGSPPPIRQCRGWLGMGISESSESGQGGSPVGSVSRKRECCYQPNPTRRLLRWISVFWKQSLF